MIVGIFYEFIVDGEPQMRYDSVCEFPKHPSWETIIAIAFSFFVKALTISVS